MTQLNGKDVDLLIKKAIRSEVKNSPTPLPAAEAWKQLESRLNSQQSSSKRPSFFRSKLFYAVAIIFVSLTIFLSPQNSGAHNTIIEVFQKVQESVTHLFIKVGDDGPTSDDQAPTEDFYIIDETEITSFELSIEDAQKETAFFIKQPKVVPEGYTLKDVTVFKSEDEQSDEIFLNYEGREGNFSINQRLLGESFSAGVTIDNDDTQVDSIEIHGQPASLLQYKDDSAELIWANESYHYSISGTLTKDEIIEMAKSM